MKHITPIFLIVFELCLPQSAQADGTKPYWEAIELDRVEEGSVIHFKSTDEKIPPPAPLKTNLFGLQPLGVLHGYGKEIPSYFAFSGKSCANCPEEKAVYFVRGTGGRMDRFVFPGRIIDPKKRETLVDSRAFVGRCLRRVPGDVYVVFQQERIDRRRHLQSSMFVAQPGPSFLAERLIERRLPNIRESVALAKGKHCREIDGFNRMMVAKPINLRPNREAPAIDEDDDEPVPEAQPSPTPETPGTPETPATTE